MTSPADFLWGGFFEKKANEDSSFDISKVQESENSKHTPKKDVESQVKRESEAAKNVVSTLDTPWYTSVWNLMSSASGQKSSFAKNLSPASQINLSINNTPSDAVAFIGCENKNIEVKGLGDTAEKKIKKNSRTSLKKGTFLADTLSDEFFQSFKKKSMETLEGISFRTSQETVAPITATAGNINDQKSGEATNVQDEIEVIEMEDEMDSGDASEQPALVTGSITAEKTFQSGPVDIRTPSTKQGLQQRLSDALLKLRSVEKSESTGESKEIVEENEPISGEGNTCVSKPELREKATVKQHSLELDDVSESKNDVASVKNHEKLNELDHSEKAFGVTLPREELTDKLPQSRKETMNTEKKRVLENEKLDKVSNSQVASESCFETKKTQEKSFSGDDGVSKDWFTSIIKRISSASVNADTPTSNSKI